jgi:hypothetical protein
LAAANNATNNEDDNNNNNKSEVRARCRDCGTIFNASNNERRSSCPSCGSNNRDLIAVNNDPVITRETVGAQLKTEKRNSRWFYLTVGVTMGAPFTALIPDLNPFIGIGLGVIFGIASLRLDKRAYTIIIRMYESR